MIGRIVHVAALAAIALSLSPAAFAQNRKPTWTDIGYTALDTVGSLAEVGTGLGLTITQVGAPWGLALLGKGVLDTTATAINIAHLACGEQRGASSALGQLGGMATARLGIGEKTGEMLGDGVDLVITVPMVINPMTSHWGAIDDYYPIATKLAWRSDITAAAKSAVTAFHELVLADEASGPRKKTAVGAQ